MKWIVIGCLMMVCAGCTKDLHGIVSNKVTYSFEEEPGKTALLTKDFRNVFWVDPFELFFIASEEGATDSPSEVRIGILDNEIINASMPFVTHRFYLFINDYTLESGTPESHVYKYRVGPEASDEGEKKMLLTVTELKGQQLKGRIEGKIQRGLSTPIGPDRRVSVHFNIDLTPR